MKKVIFGLLLLAGSIMADVTTILPYIGQITYDSNSAKSAKNRANIYGVHASRGDLSYLVQVDISHISTLYKNADFTQLSKSNKKFKDVNSTQLSQNDITLSYAKYYTNFMFKLGNHYISSNDEELGDGNVLMASTTAYTYLGSNKVTAGVEGYYSHYNKGHDENYTAKPITIFQVTPFVSFYYSINENWGNTLILKVNYQTTTDYLDKNYLSNELSDTIYYRSLFVTLGTYTGTMRTGVKDEGLTVFNTLDLMKVGYNMSVGYYLAKNAVISLRYEQNLYREYGFAQDGVRSFGMASFSYSF
jgi:hypothetical protein